MEWWLQVGRKMHWLHVCMFEFEESIEGAKLSFLYLTWQEAQPG
jgi:hypothetical protein